MPDAAREEVVRDLAQGLGPDPGIDRTIEEALAWICRAQDCSATADGGVARHYSLVEGWGPSYPETTGYIVPLLLEFADDLGDEALRRRARRMLDWLAAIQLPGGGFTGSTADRVNGGAPVTFNTGQILLGFASGVERLGPEYARPLHAAARWLVETQDADGCWRRYASAYARAGDKTYDTHVAWGLLEAGRVTGVRDYTEAALRNVQWALTRQRANGWFEDCCLSDPGQPLTHTIGYVLRGVVEAHRHNGDPSLLAAACRTAAALTAAVEPSGFLPGRLDSRWHGTVPWACLTGSAQIATCWLVLHRRTGDVRLRDAAYAVNAFVRRTVAVEGPDTTRGGVKGSFPVSGGYGTYCYLNWAARFFIEANRLEREIRSTE